MDRRIEKAFDIIKRDYSQKLDLERLAARVELSQFHFQRLFKKELGETPKACLQRVRLERASHMLRAGIGKTISEIAFDCGFTSLSSFSRAFSKKFGVSPQAFTNDSTGVPRVLHVKVNELQPEVEVVYQPETLVFYTVSSINDDNLLEAFNSAKTFCELNNIPVVDRMIGISTYTTFHYPRDPRNYYAGIEIKGPVPEKFAGRIFRIPAGKYAAHSSGISIRDYQEQALKFKVLWLDKSEYVRRELFSFDEIDPNVKKSDYPFLKRRTYTPVKRK